MEDKVCCMILMVTWLLMMILSCYGNRFSLVDIIPMCTIVSLLIGKPLSLQGCCRIAIRRHLGHERLCAISGLPLPSILSAYLNFSDMSVQLWTLTCGLAWDVIGWRQLLDNLHRNDRCLAWCYIVCIVCHNVVWCCKFFYFWLLIRNGITLWKYITSSLQKIDWRLIPRCWLTHLSMKSKVAESKPLPRYMGLLPIAYRAVLISVL